MSGEIDEARQAARIPSRERSGLALCLSGGGYRATLFHLGAARRLHELGLLGRLDTISSVSGGSIFAGALADLALREGWEGSLAIDDFEAQVAAPVRRLTKKDMRTVPFLLYLPVDWLFPSLRAWHLIRLCKKHVSKRSLAGLPEKPLFVFCASDITFGVNWEASRERVGSFRAGYLADGGAWPVGRAVAASACFPPVFGPMRVGASADQYRDGKFPRTDEGNSLRRRLALSDGGVYDNMGLEPVWKSHACVLVSDCGAPFQFRAGGSVVRRLLRYTSVIQNQAHAVRTRMFFAGIDEGWHTGARWGIGAQTSRTEPGYSDELTERIARVRTDLNRFTDGEQRILENHGYCVTDARLREHAPELLPAQPPPAAPPHPAWMDEKKARAALRASDKRVSLRRFVTRSGR
jgi:NTE family protein